MCVCVCVTGLAGVHTEALLRALRVPRASSGAELCRSGETPREGDVGRWGRQWPDTVDTVAEPRNITGLGPAPASATSAGGEAQ